MVERNEDCSRGTRVPFVKTRWVWKKCNVGAAKLGMNFVTLRPVRRTTWKREINIVRMQVCRAQYLLLHWLRKNNIDLSLLCCVRRNGRFFPLSASRYGFFRSFWRVRKCQPPEGVLLFLCEMPQGCLWHADGYRQKSIVLIGRNLWNRFPFHVKTSSQIHINH